MLVFDACLLWFILVIIESRSLRAKLWHAADHYSPIKATNRFLSKARSYCWQVPQFVVANKDLIGEQMRSEQIIQSKSTHNYSMVVNNLTKVYKTNQFKAVDQLSFVVDKRGFFGLLGVNGEYRVSGWSIVIGPFVQLVCVCVASNILTTTTYP